MTTRDRLIAKGFLTPDGRLTEAGNAYVDELLATLRRARDDGAGRGAGVRWRR